MADKDAHYEAPWTENLRHRPDPNRVQPLVDGGHAAISAPPWQSSPQSPPGVSLEPRRAHASPQSETGSESEPSYYDVSPLKRPVWKWQIANYFYFGGMSAGAYLIARAADRAGRGRHRAVARTGVWVALAALAPCPPLLIDDLGDPKRFHHMLRVFKPASPMNLGTWMLTGYGGALAAAAARELLRDFGLAPEEAPPPAGEAAKTWLDAHDLAGIPLATTVAGYTGVLLSCTANPLWCKNRWLGPLFSASAVSTGAEAISLALDLSRREEREEQDASQRVLQKIDSAAHVAEAVCITGFRREAGEKGKSLEQGPVSKVHRFATGALIASEVLKRLPVKGKWRKPVRMLAAASGLAAGFALRWAMVYGGKQAADDPHTARLVSRPQRGELAGDEARSSLRVSAASGATEQR
ncbi:MAG TPA: NrfD/PsrC family molybdoenzyme membrane anchor subunit [Pirellulales bacterium]|nr:NrfD/PsrC family molybdoenzyme membrane anchor subunit [Pirellulales bacterium]